jgi:hypothetical protein
MTMPTNRPMRTLSETMDRMAAGERRRRGGRLGLFIVVPFIAFIMGGL